MSNNSFENIATFFAGIFVSVFLGLGAIILATLLPYFSFINWLLLGLFTVALGTVYFVRGSSHLKFGLALDFGLWIILIYWSHGSLFGPIAY